MIWRTSVLRTVLVTAFSSIISSAALAQTTVNSLSALKTYLDDNNANVKLSPGTYSIDAADVASGAFGNPLLLVSGNNSTYDFTGVTLMIDTDVFQAFGNVDVQEVAISGNGNVLKNLTMIDDGSVDDRPTRTALNILMDGEGNRVEGFHVTVKGSQPYAYGDAFGKGSGYAIKHFKHSACLVRGNSNHVKNCTFIHRAYGHGIFMQGAVGALIEGCYIEGEVRSTDDMLAETSGPAYDRDFLTVWGYRLPPGYMMSLQEDGIRTYTSGTTVVDGVSYTRHTSNITVRNCTIKYMRSGVSMPLGSGYRNAEDCTAIGCESGFGLRGGTIVNCSADVAYGPVYRTTYSNDNNLEADITVLPASDPYYNGSGAIAWIGGNDHEITLRGTENPVNQNLKVLIGGEFDDVRNLGTVDSHNASNVDIDNLTSYPLLLTSASSGTTGSSYGAITNNGSNNNVTNANRVVTIAKRSALGYGIDGGNGAANGQNVYLWGYNANNVNQQWQEIDRGNGYYTYQKQGTSYSIDGGNGGADRQNVYLWSTGPSNYNQHWQKVDKGGGYFQLRKRNSSGFAINGGSGGTNGQNVNLYNSSSSSHNLQWRIQYQ
ncbi:RICIN domain-containing protein [Haloferula chungangensis]|uniref:RICIN domain-containing protein n=1 Tax=Haloferula chungangensis TaxID=1048331 RepID=A0ABW2L741_9BACT